MKKKKVKKKWWEKEWDREFGDFLKETAIYIGKNITFNDVAKQRIETIVQKEIRDMCNRHNMIAIAYERSVEKNQEGIKKIKSLIGIFERTKESSDHYIKELKKILNN